MRFTPNLGIPALEPTDRARDIAEIDWQRAQRLEAVLMSRGVDTGWRNINPSNDAVELDGNEPAQYRVYDHVVYLRGQYNAVGGSLPGGTYGRLPIAARPTGQRFVTLVLQSAAAGARLVVNTDGSLGFNHQGTASTYVRLDGATYPAPA